MLRRIAVLFAGFLAVAPVWAEDEARYGVIVERDVMVAMRDGVRLAIDVYRPDAPGTFPALVERTPYDKTRSSEIRAEAHTYFAERGYVFMVQDVRGRYASEGNYYPFRDAGWDARTDGYDTIAWIADQPWSNGSVGVVGGSHTGQTAYMLAQSQPPALGAIFARESASDLHKHWIYRGGAFEYGFVTAWVGLTFAGDIITRTLTERPAARARGAIQAFLDNPQPYFTQLPVNGFEPYSGIEGLSFYYDWLAEQADGPYWQRQAIAREHADFTVPVAHLGGWYDIFLQGTIENYEGLRDNAGSALARDNQRLVIGPWVHGPTNVGVTQVGELEFPGADAVGYNAIRARWFDHWLRGIDNGVTDEPPVLIYVMGDNRWRHENEWPLARTEVTNLYFREDGLAAEAPGADEGASSFTYDPATPVPTLGGNTLFLPGGPRDHRAADALSLTFTGEPLDAPLEVTGPVTAVLYGASSAVDTDWTVRLSEVYPDGRSINIVDGIVRARYRDDPAAPHLLEPGEIVRYEVDLWATSNVFQAGNRMRVSVHSSNFPRWDRNLNTAESPEEGTTWVTATNTVYHDAEHPSHIVLPVIPR
ncbi:MAG: CocE/NonD family hydrolase [Alphaproteobacteria bacterium]|jgi:hypothetical protein|nr:CocE/NonD family hydrolase [Alphaproteobacteria bacterium]